MVKFDAVVTTDVRFKPSLVSSLESPNPMAHS